MFPLARRAATAVSFTSAFALLDTAIFKAFVAPVVLTVRNAQIATFLSSSEVTDDCNTAPISPITASKGVLL